MAKLIFLLDGNVIKEYALNKERMTIGRRASNDIHIDNLAISGEHAAIITINGNAFIEDLNSTNGTLINKKQIKKHMLKHGDDIGLGKYELRYVKDKDEAANANKQDGFADTVLVAPKSEPKDDAVQGIVGAPSSALKTPAVADPAEAQPNAADKAQADPTVAKAKAESDSVNTDKQGPRLEILNGENAGNTLLLDRSMVKVGQPDQQVAVVTKRQEAYFITHVSGDNYPFVNGSRIGQQACALSNHDEIEVLDIKMMFRLD